MEKYRRSIGAVAQLGERLVRNEEVVGSTPISSTRSLYLLRSSPAQLQVAQPRQVRKEATVGYQRCDAGELDLFFLLVQSTASRRPVCPVASPKFLFKR